MIFREQDPDVVRWGLHTLIDVCALPRSPSCNSVVVTRYNTDEAEIGYVVEGYSVEPVVTNTVENDAVIALALQEELSRIAAAEASGAHNSAAQASILSQDWVGSEHKSDDCSSKKDDDDDDSSKCKREETDEMLFSFPSPGTGEDESLHSLEIADESLDGEVGKRLYQMVPIPHVPKINGEMPSEDEVVSDHQRLLDRLQLYDLVENKVQGDGNCQFRALSDQLYRSPEYHKVVRDRINFQLKSQPQKYDGYVPMAYGDYLKKMSKFVAFTFPQFNPLFFWIKGHVGPSTWLQISICLKLKFRNGEWGDHVTLQAAADSYGMKIFVLTSFKDTCYIEILPHTIMSERVIFLSFWAEVHYNSIYPEGELPLYETKKKKKWWMLGT